VIFSFPADFSPAIFIIQLREHAIACPTLISYKQREAQPQLQSAQITYSSGLP
jgi:hypothetical protein